MGVGEGSDRTEGSKFQGLSRGPTLLKDLAIAKSLAPPSSGFLQDSGVRVFYKGVREEINKSYQLCLQSLVEVCLLLTLFSVSIGSSPIIALLDRAVITCHVSCPVCPCLKARGPQ